MINGCGQSEYLPVLNRFNIDLKEGVGKLKTTPNIIIGASNKGRKVARGLKCYRLNAHRIVNVGTLLIFNGGIR